MGCDIHTFIEYSDVTDQQGDPYWQCFGGQINLGRDYKMFGLMAGVRSSHQLFEPRGLPEGKTSYQIETYMTIWINDEHAGSDNTCTLAEAQDWAKRGETIINDRDGKPYRVTNPDLHSHSWLELDEFRFVLDYYRLGDKAADIDEIDFDDPADREAVMQAVAALHGGGDTYAPEYGAALTLMEYFAERGFKTRLVFCFDN